MSNSMTDPRKVSIGNTTSGPASQSDADSVRRQVRSDYARVAQASDTGDCCGETAGCCGVSDEVQINSLISVRLGYSQADLDLTPAGAAMIDDLEAMILAAGFADIKIAPKDESREFIRDWAPGRGVEDYVVSATIEAVKPSR